MQKFEFYKLPDIILLFFLLVIPLYAIINRTDVAPRNPVAVVEIDGKQEYAVSLDRPKKLKLNEWNLPVILGIKTGKIRILENDCQKNICIHTGYINRAGQTIVCVPKKILIYIQSSRDSSSNKINAITG